MKKQGYTFLFSEALSNEGFFLTWSIKTLKGIKMSNVQTIEIQ